VGLGDAGARWRPPDAGEAPRPGVWPSADNAPRIELESTPFGFHYAAIRDATVLPGNTGPGKKFVRITAFVLPYTAIIGGSNGGVIVVPRDDYSCSTIGVFRLPPGTDRAVAETRARRGIDPAVWGPEPENRRLKLPKQDREAMAAGQSFAGFRGGNRVQDGAVQMPADLAIIRMRRLFADSIQLIEAGHDPVGIGVDYDSTQVTAVSTIIDADQDWRDLVPGQQGTREPAS
jgi:phthalate 4,5-dioxygenase oxygenase subunit